MKHKHFDQSGSHSMCQSNYDFLENYIFYHRIYLWLRNTVHDVTILMSSVSHDVIILMSPVSHDVMILMSSVSHWS